MRKLNRKDFPGPHYPERIIQFGEGNFLRAFIDWQIDQLNQHTDLAAGVVVVRPLSSGSPRSLNSQDGLYTTVIRGINAQGEVVSEPRLIRSVNREIQPVEEFAAFMALAQDPQLRFVFSNTTEAGIYFDPSDTLESAPPVSYPAKLTRLLLARWQHFDGAADKGWLMLPCELIDDNGEALRARVLQTADAWQLPAAFVQWVEQHNTFCSTLVDRIVTGYPDDASELEQQLGYLDDYLVAGEVYYQLVIQGPASVAQELRLDQLPLNILLVDDIKPYKERKVAILNGAHTAMVPVAYLAGLESVGEAMEDAAIAAFIDSTLREEIIPTLTQPKAELDAFADSVLNRFRNPFIRHQLSAIALNGMTKFRTRLLPALLWQQEHQGQPSPRLSFALAALLAYYRGERNGERYPLQDDAHWLERFATLWPQVDCHDISLRQLVDEVLSDVAHWEQDLTQLPGLAERVTTQLQQITTLGMRAAMAQIN
ncbi:tagaturonate reductase [Erwinia sorbitola]|uniref:Tagaturonate reductase n=1 Tax=Erwinia sorbitola TaxID=2681984 RepID=A0A6I6EGY6_9GAMM|nr:tagaturonate reductase [Erwinia sorbitola]MTD27536.1 tagaturonate reductase [Erwinia sorbitola]QGU89074.1 tagaturonate reductase [Erwinia sorbitola]